MVRLFASVLKREGDKYFLVTPVEKLGIKVDDAPFLAVALDTRQPNAGSDPRVPHQCRRRGDLRRRAPTALRAGGDTGGIKPYLHVRRNLWALVTRSLFLDLVALGEVREWDGHRMFGLASAGQFFPMAPAEAVGG